LALLLADPANPSLHLYPLKGRYTDYRSFNVTGDVPAVFCLDIHPTTQVNCQFLQGLDAPPRR